MDSSVKTGSPNKIVKAKNSKITLKQDNFEDLYQSISTVIQNSIIFHKGLIFSNQLHKIRNLHSKINKNEIFALNDFQQQPFTHKRSITQPQMALAGYIEQSIKAQTGRINFIEKHRNKNRTIINKTIEQRRALPEVSRKSNFLKIIESRWENEKDRNTSLKNEKDRNASLKKYYMKDMKKQSVDYSKFRCLMNSKFSIQSVQLVQIIGTGANAQVRVGIDENGSKYAVKIYEKYKLPDQRKKKRVYQQIKILSSLNHPNIIKLIQAYQDRKQIHLLFEFIEQSKNLQDIFRSKLFQMETSEISRILRNVTNGLKYLHNQGYAHRDIKPSNVLVSDSKVKIIDFGFATTENKSQLYCGTRNYMAPQFYDKSICYSPKKVDIWAFGVMIYYLFQSTFPFKGFNSKDLLRNIKEGRLQFKRTPIAISQILESLLRAEPQNRSCLDDVFF